MKHPITPERLSALKDLAGILAQTGQARASKLDPPDVLLMILTGEEFGWGPGQALRSFHSMKGKLVLSADAIIGLCLAHPACAYFSMTRSDDNQATYITHRKGAPEPVSLTWTMAMAKRAGLTGNRTWTAHPEAMLRARCAAALARMVYPDAVGGIYSEDEGREIAGEYSAPIVAPRSAPPSPAKPTPPQPDGIARAIRQAEAESIGRGDRRRLRADEDPRAMTWPLACLADALYRNGIARATFDRYVAAGAGVGADPTEAVIEAWAGVKDGSIADFCDDDPRQFLAEMRDALGPDGWSAVCREAGAPHIIDPTDPGSLSDAGIGPMRAALEVIMTTDHAASFDAAARMEPNA